MKKFVRAQLEVQNVRELDEQIAHGRVDSVYSPLIRLLAEALDESASGENTWVTIGKTKDASALVLTVNRESGRLTGYASTLGGLSAEAEKLL